MNRRPYLQATPRYATPLPKPAPSMAYRLLEATVLVAGIGVVLAYITIFGAPL